jgi:NosR/NirI family nitrous oxide reductase transcriptional regulator
MRLSLIHRASAWRATHRAWRAAFLCLFLAVSGAAAAAEVGWSEALLREAFPEAEGFGPLEGDPAAIPAYRGGTLQGYVFSSHQVVRSRGYSAMPLDVLIGLDVDGIIRGAVIAEHHEPILIIGVGDADLKAFVGQYRGRDVREAVRLKPIGRGQGGIDAVSGATISSLVINDAILRSARSVARSRGLIGGAQARLDFEDFAPASWRELVDEGSLRRLHVTVGDARRAVEQGGGRLLAEGVPMPPDEATFLELFTGLATPARVGRNLLGKRRFGTLFADLASDDQLFFVAGRGLYSFKGRSYRRSGVFNRLELVQGNRTFRFRKDDHQGFERLEISDGLDLREMAIFTLPGSRGFDPTRPWRLRVLVEGVEEEGVTPFALFDLPYSLPERYLSEPAGEAMGEDGALWIQTWRARAPQIVVLTLGLLVLTVILVFQDAVVKRRKLYQGLRTGFLLFTLIWIGWFAGAQLSVINVLTFFNALTTEFTWDFFLLEPLIFILWSYVAVTIIFLGRGVFCGWLCPFGALQELLARLGRLARLPQWRLPFALHERLWPIKYIIFIGLFAAFLRDPGLAVKGAEVEPFKTAIVLKFARAWPFVLYAGALLVAGLFVTRAYCRYLCPLGAALALPARVSMFEWLKRRWQCGTPCQTCAQTCPVQAIHPEGKINPNECIHCLTCQVNYNDDGICPPLAERKRRRDRARRSAQAKETPTAQNTEDGPAEGREAAPG